MGYDIRVRRHLLTEPSQNKLDEEASFLLSLTKGMLEKYGL